MTQPTWRDLTPGQRKAIALLVPLEIALTALAAADLARRPSALVRGRKAAWWPALLVQPAGPIAYLVWGRSR
ncbi:PLDc N-terminal domain-containing protein [Actinoplanes philippinensis]|uniref:PLDc N-terminal domain-containing protein n=1 Tax=Actinoplanes philippinensis TaxID=35752 RepID=UPI0034013B0A